MGQRLWAAIRGTPPPLDFRPVWYVAIVALVGIFAIVVVQLIAKDGEANSATVALAGLATLLLFVVLAPRSTRQALRGVANVKVAGIELALKEITRVERVKPLPGQGDGVTVKQRRATGDPDTGLTTVIEQLEGRLRFTWDILELGRTTGIEKWDYGAIVSQLCKAQLLTEDEDRFIHDTLRGHRLDIARWSIQTRTDFLDSAWQFATRFGPQIWERHVRRKLNDDGWLVVDYDDRSRLDPYPRPDGPGLPDRRRGADLDRLRGCSAGQHVAALGGVSGAEPGRLDHPDRRGAARTRLGLPAAGDRVGDRLRLGAAADLARTPAGRRSLRRCGRLAAGHCAGATRAGRGGRGTRCRGGRWSS